MKGEKLFINQFALKIIALLTMTSSHIGYMMITGGYFAVDSPGYMAAMILQYIGRLAFPLFAFMLAEGMRKTHDRLNYIMRLGLMCLAIILVQTAMFLIDKDMAGTMEGNAFLDLIVAALFIYLLEHPNKWLRPLAILPFGYVLLCYAMDISEIYASNNNAISVWSSFYPSFLRCSYNLYGFLIIVSFYFALPLAKRVLKMMTGGDEEMYGVVATESKLQGFSNAISALFLVVINLIFWALIKFGLPDPYYMEAQSYAAIAAVLIIFYNGKRGYNAKWWKIFNYLYYPVHLVLIWGIFVLCFMH